MCCFVTCSFLCNISQVLIRVSSSLQIFYYAYHQFSDCMHHHPDSHHPPVSVSLQTVALGNVTVLGSLAERGSVV